MTRWTCSICGQVSRDLNHDSLIDLGWSHLTITGKPGPRYYFCPGHTPEEIVSVLAKDPRLKRILRGDTPRGTGGGGDPGAGE